MDDDPPVGQGTHYPTLQAMKRWDIQPPLSCDLIPPDSANAWPIDQPFPQAQLSRLEDRNMKEQMAAAQAKRHASPTNIRLQQLVAII